MLEVDELHRLRRPQRTASGAHKLAAACNRTRLHLPAGPRSDDAERLSSSFCCSSEGHAYPPSTCHILLIEQRTVMHTATRSLRSYLTYVQSRAMIAGMRSSRVQPVRTHNEQRLHGGGQANIHDQFMRLQVRY